MIRNVVLGRTRPDHDRAALDEGLAGIVALQQRLAGVLDVRVGRDAGLREGTWDFAITVDLVDAEAYRRYDEDEEHARLRRDLIGPNSETLARVQIEV